MKKKFLLFGFALTSVLGASAQTCEVLDATIKPGGKGTITVKFDEDVEWNGINTIGVNFKLPEGISLGDWSEADWGGVLDGAAVPSGNRMWENNDGFCTLGVAAYEIEFEDGQAVTMTFPIVASAGVEEKDYSLAGTEGSMIIGDELFIEDDNLVNGTLTVSGSAVSSIEGTVYLADGTSVVKNFKTKQDVADVLDGNVIVAFASEAPAGAEKLKNVIVAGVAESIVLTNDAPYTYTGTAFTAKSVEFTYNFTTKASKAGGWNSLAIPFTGTPDVDPFTTADKENGKFWAKEFVSATESGLEFADLASAQFVANKSYIVAFPGESYGSNEFVGNSIVISNTDATVQPSTSVKAAEATPFTMKTIYAGQAPKDSYVLDPALNKFVKQDAAADVKPFQAYAIASSSAAPALRSLAILDANKGLTSVEAVAANAGVVVYANEGEIVINANESGVASVYNMNGQVVKANVKYNEGETRIAGLAAGAYVVAGQVVVLK